MKKIPSGLNVEQLKEISDYFLDTYQECNKDVRHKNFLYYGKNPCAFILDERMKYYREYKKVKQNMFVESKSE